jgi:hypothetical protein
MAKPKFWDVYENVTGAMVRVWREPAAKAWFVAVPDRRKLGTAIPAMNKAIVSLISSCRRERALCNFMRSPHLLAGRFDRVVFVVNYRS